MISVLLALALCVASPSSEPPGQKPPASPQKAVGSVEWTDPAGDVKPLSTSSGTVPGFDLVKLALASDGTALTITATLASAPKGSFASDVAKLYIDTDSNPATGFPTFWGHTPGFEMKAELRLCMEYENGGRACSGALTESKVKGYYSSLALGTIQDTSGNTRSAFPSFEEPKGTVQGPVVSATVSYKDLGVKPGQTVRIVAVESSGPSDATAEFPTVLLTLK